MPAIVRIRLIAILGALAALIGATLSAIGLVTSCEPGGVSSGLIGLGVAAIVGADLRSRRH